MSFNYSFTLARDITWDCELSVLPEFYCDIRQVFSKNIQNALSEIKDVDGSDGRIISEAVVYLLFWKLSVVQDYFKFSVPYNILSGHVYLMQLSNGLYIISNENNSDEDTSTWYSPVYLCKFECNSDVFETEFAMHVSLSMYRQHSNVYKFKHHRQAIKLCKQAFVMRKTPEIIL